MVEQFDSDLLQLDVDYDQATDLKYWLKELLNNAVKEYALNNKLLESEEDLLANLLNKAYTCK